MLYGDLMVMNTINDARDRRVAEMVAVARGNYNEMPGLLLTKPQAGRLLGLNGDMCSAVLDVLIREKYLSLRTDGQYGRFQV